MSPDEIRQKTQQLEARIRRRSLAHFAVVIFMAFLGSYAVIAGPVSQRIVGGLILAAALYVACQIHKRGSTGPVPPDAALATCLAFYRAELQRQRDSLRGIWSWYLGPILGALLAFALWGPLSHLDQPGLWRRIAPFVGLFVLWCLATGKLAQREARQLQGEIDALDGLEKQH